MEENERRIVGYNYNDIVSVYIDSKEQKGFLGRARVLDCDEKKTYVYTRDSDCLYSDFVDKNQKVNEDITKKNKIYTDLFTEYCKYGSLTRSILINFVKHFRNKRNISPLEFNYVLNHFYSLYAEVKSNPDLAHLFPYIKYKPDYLAKFVFQCGDHSHNSRPTNKMPFLRENRYYLVEFDPEINYNFDDVKEAYKRGIDLAIGRFNYVQHRKWCYISDLLVLNPDDDYICRQQKLFESKNKTKNDSRKIEKLQYDSDGEYDNEDDSEGEEEDSSEIDS